MVSIKIEPKHLITLTIYEIPKNKPQINVVLLLYIFKLSKIFGSIFVMFNRMLII